MPELFVPCPHGSVYSPVCICGAERNCPLKRVNFTVSKLYITIFFFTQRILTPIAFELPTLSVSGFSSLTLDSVFAVLESPGHSGRGGVRSTLLHYHFPSQNLSSPLKSGFPLLPLPGLCSLSGTAQVDACLPPFRRLCPCCLPVPALSTCRRAERAGIRSGGSRPARQRLLGQRWSARPCRAGAAPTEVEAFVQVLGVEEDPPGVGVDVGARSDEQRGDVSLPPLDGDVQCRLPWNRARMGGRSAAGPGGHTLSGLFPSLASVLSTEPQRNPSCLPAPRSGARRWGYGGTQHVVLILFLKKLRASEI